MEIEQLAVERPEALARVAVDPNVGIDAGQGRTRSSPRRASTTETGAKIVPRPAEALGRLSGTRTRRSSRSTRSSRPPTATSSRSTARSRSTRTPTSATPTTRRSRTPPRPTRSRRRPRRRASTTSSSTATSASSATAPGWSCRPSTSSRMPGRSAGGAEAGELPRHRWRRLGRGHGRRACTSSSVTRRSQSVFVNVFGGITACDAVANGIVGALDTLGDEATKPLVVRLDGNNVEEGRRILAERQPPARDHRRDHGRRGPQGRRARRRANVREGT